MKGTLFIQKDELTVLKTLPGQSLSAAVQHHVFMKLRLAGLPVQKTAAEGVSAYSEDAVWTLLRAAVRKIGGTEVSMREIPQTGVVAFGWR